MASNLTTVGTQTMPQPVAALAPSDASPEHARPATPEPATPSPEDVVSSGESDVEPLTFTDYEPPSSPSSSEDDDHHWDKFLVFEASFDELLKFC